MIDPLDYLSMKVDSLTRSLGIHYHSGYAPDEMSHKEYCTKYLCVWFWYTVFTMIMLIYMLGGLGVVLLPVLLISITGGLSLVAYPLVLSVLLWWRCNVNYNRNK